MKFESYTQELAEIWRKFRISPHGYSDSRPCVKGTEFTGVELTR